MSTDVEPQADEVVDDSYDFDDPSAAAPPAEEPKSTEEQPQEPLSQDPAESPEPQPPQQDPAPPAFTDQHYAAAEQYGLSREAVDQIGNPVALGYVLQTMGQAYQHYQNQFQQQPPQQQPEQPQNTEPPKPKTPDPFSFGLGAENFDPELGKALDAGMARFQETMSNSVSQQVAEFRQQLDQMYQAQQQVNQVLQQQEAQRAQSQVDDFISNLSEELQGTLGRSDAERVWGTTQHQAYDQLINTANAISVANPNASIPELLQMALNANHPQQSPPSESQSQKPRGPDGRYVKKPTSLSRPNNRTPRDDRTPEQRAADNMRDRIREWGVEDDLADGEF